MKFNQEFRKLFSFFPCIDATELDKNLPNKPRPPVPLASQPQSTTSQLRRTNCQRRSPNTSPVSTPVQQRTYQNTTNDQTSSTTIRKKDLHERQCLCFSNNNPKHPQTLFGNHNNYYSSKIDRSIVNCEKFLPDQDLTNSTRENDLLLLHARQSTRFM